MAYVKTNWVDNTTPIDKNNLNKIEQGIYNNSLVVDAVTNTINPTDTTTYKTAELTEGQFTDVIGVNDIVIKGQTEQDGEPTPSSPVDVNVVSGSNVINTSNKNLFDVKNYVSTFREDRLTMKKIDSNNFTLFGNGDSIFCLIFLGKVKNLKGKSLYFKCTTSKTLERGYAVVSCNGSGENRNDIFSLNFNGNVLSGTGTIGNNIDENLYVAVRLYATGSAFPDSVTYTNVQVHYGTTATTYEPHQGKELPLDLPVENLLDKDNANILNGYIDITNKKIYANANSRTLYIQCKPNSYYAISKIAGTIFRVGATETTPILNNVLVNNPVANNSGTKIIYQTGSQDIYLVVTYFGSNDTISEQTILDSIQIEQGSKANAYTPFGTEPIELCKIGNYQDYFYKENNKWYLHKEIGKVIYDGSENWEDRPNYTNADRFVLAENRIPTQPINGYSKYFVVYKDVRDEMGILENNGSQIVINFSTKGSTTLVQFKEWLSTHNTSIYYVLASAINTEITDTTLISQLEAIYNAPLYEQTNITQTNNDLPMILDITACKDNINGIKAFIRK